MLNKRFSRNWTGRAIYTYAKTLDFYSTTGLPQAQVPNSLIVDATNLDRQKGRTDFDARPRFVFNATYDVPRLANAAANRVIGGWQVAFVGVFQTGLPFTVHTSAPFGGGGDFNADGDNYDVPNAPSFGNHIKATSRADFQRGLFEAADFPLPPAGVEGDLDRNTLDHPGYATVDLQLMKVFPIPWATAEGADLQIRLEALNGLNRVNLTPVIHSLTSALFGRSTQSILLRKITAGIRIESRSRSPEAGPWPPASGEPRECPLGSRVETPPVCPSGSAGHAADALRR